MTLAISCSQTQLTDQDFSLAPATAGCGVFGRDEGGSEFTFAQDHVDVLIDKWSQIVQAKNYNALSKPTADTIMVCELSISDVNKPKLLANASFISYAVDALLLVRATDTLHLAS